MATTTSVLTTIREVNYSPALHGWTNMWTAFDPVAIDRDFGRIAAMHANTVRIVLPAYTIGYPTPLPAMLNELAQVVTLAANHGLRLHLTLFDWWSAYDDLAGSKAWAHAVLSPYAGDNRIFTIELQNEIDQGQGNTTALQQGTTLAWARAMIPYLRGLGLRIPITVAISEKGGLATLRTWVTALTATPPDFYTYHVYGSGPGELYAVLQQAKQIVAPLPLFVGETGFSTSTANMGIPGLASDPSALEAYQDYLYRGIDYAATQLGLPPPAPWTFTDAAPGSIPPGLTADDPTNYAFGLEHADGTPKPALQSVAAYFGSGTVNTDFNAGFEERINTNQGILPTDWRINHGSQGTFALDTTVAHGGTASVRISDSTGDSLGVPAFYITPITGHVVPGQPVTFAAYARGAALTGRTDVAIAWFDVAGTYLGTVTSRALPTGTTGWTLLQVTGMSPPGAAYIQVHLQSAYNNGTAWFDDVAVS